MRFRSFFIFFLFALALGEANAQERQPYRVAVFVPYPPFAYLDKTGNLAGFNVDIAQALCNQIKSKCTIVSVPFADIIPGLVNGSIDFAVAGMGTTPDREKLIDFTIPYFRSHSIFIENRDNMIEITPEGLKGKRIGTQAGTLQEIYLKKQYGDIATILTWPNFDEPFEALRQRKVDLIFVDGLPGYSFLKSAAGEGMETVGQPVRPSMLHNRNTDLDEGLETSSIAVSKRHPKLREILNRALQEIRQNGEYGRINRKYFDFDIY